MHILIRGPVQSGKTTWIKKIIEKYPYKFKGFFTEQILDDKGQREGFKLVSLSGEVGLFAHKNKDKLPFQKKVSSYYVNVELLDSFITRHLKPALDDDCDFVVIDEIGKMELLSESFRQLCLKCFAEKKVLATLPKEDLPFIKKLLSQFGNESCVFFIEKDVDISAKLDLAINALESRIIKEKENILRQWGLEERLLIENASSNFSWVFRQFYGPQYYLVGIVGKGNNAADVAASLRKLISFGYKGCCLALNQEKANSECRFQLNLLNQMGIEIISADTIKKIQNFLASLEKRSFVIIDGILGVGVKGEVRGLPGEVIEVINNINCPVVSCDLPSGLDPDRGWVLGKAIKADLTITFFAPKLGFFINQGPEYTGKIVLTHIGIDRKYINS